MLRLSQVAERLNCSISNVYSLIEQGRLVAICIGANGKGYRVSESDLQSFLTEGRRHPGRDAPPFSEKSKPYKLKHVR
jgi:excisionase family DNA binding protein